MSDDAVDNYEPSQIHLKTVNGHYVCAENGGGGLVVANRREAREWETFRLYDRTGASGSRLQHGSTVALRARSGQYVYPEGGGGGRVVAKGPAIGGWEPFAMVSVDNKTGPVVSGDRIALRAVRGQYLYPEGGGGAGLVAKGPAIGGWEPFEIQIVPRVIDLRTSAGQTVYAQNGGNAGVISGSAPVYEWEDFYLFNTSGTLPLIHNDMVRIATHDLRYYVNLNTLQHVIATAFHPMYSDLFRIHILSNPQALVYTVALRTVRTGKYIAAEGGERGLLVANRDAIGPSETFQLRLPRSFIVG
jgi:hypothetical protein